MTSAEEKTIVVSWEGDDDPENPKNWGRTQKWIVTGLISANIMLSHISSTMIAPAASNVAMDLGATTSIFEPMLTSIFILAHAFVLSYYNAIYYVCGDSRVVQLGNMFYIIFNLACAFAKTPDQMLLFRFLAGIGGSASLSVRSDIQLGGHVINSCWSGREFSRPKHLCTLAPLFGPNIGPIAGAWITMKTTWKWIFWTTSIASMLTQVGHLFWLKETFAPIILARKARRLQNASSGEDNVRYIISDLCLTSDSIYKILLLYSVYLLSTEPIIQLLGMYLAYMYDLSPLILTSLPGIFVGVYHESIGVAGLHYIAFGIGLYSGAQITNAIQHIYVVYARIPISLAHQLREALMLPATLFVAIGLFIAGWSVSNGVCWVVTDIVSIFACGICQMNWHTMKRYIVRAYTDRTTPALEGVYILRSAVAFALPSCSPSLYQNLGYGKGNTILAGLALGLGLLL
ncbi:MFS polyamine transporter [Armillaria mellea]|nr:MFS polyamine transporter [Armillaria mellea]